MVLNRTFHICSHITKKWRQKIVTDKWISDYQNAGWFIEIKEFNDSRGEKISKYTFSVDSSYERDKKLSQLLSIDENP
jgi:hypothetical protein